MIEESKAYGDPAIADIYQAWRVGGVFILETDQGVQALQRTDEQRWLQVATGVALELSSVETDQAVKARPSRKLRKNMKGIMDTLGLKSEDPSVRIDSAMKMA